ncbi:MAG: hypothetical protein AMXMBFR84_25270 [Candidatus Hydrogenedentota bacterium]
MDTLTLCREDNTPMPQLSVSHPQTTIADAYDIQRELVTRTCGVGGIGGFKAAAIAAAAQTGLGIDGPITGVMPAAGIRKSTDGHTLRLDDGAPRHVETEIGYVFGEAVTVALKDIEALKKVVAYIAPIVELPGGATMTSQATTAADLIAWNINAREMIVGKPVDASTIDPDRVTIELKHNGVVVNSAKGNQAKDGQWATLLKVVNGVVGRGYAVEKGFVITNGALGTILRAEAGRYRADFGTLGTIEFEAR